MHRQQNHLAQQMQRLEEYRRKVLPHNKHTEIHRPGATHHHGSRRCAVHGGCQVRFAIPFQTTLSKGRCINAIVSCEPCTDSINLRLPIKAIAATSIRGRHGPCHKNRMPSHTKMKACWRRHTWYCTPTQTPAEEPFCSQPAARKATCPTYVKCEASACTLFIMLRI